MNFIFMLNVYNEALVDVIVFYFVLFTQILLSSKTKIVFGSLRKEKKNAKGMIFFYLMKNLKRKSNIYKII